MNLRDSAVRTGKLEVGPERQGRCKDGSLQISSLDLSEMWGWEALMLFPESEPWGSSKCV